MPKKLDEFSRKRITEALADIEAAQELISKAAQSISHVPALGQECSDLGKVRLAAGACWRALHERFEEGAIDTGDVSASASDLEDARLVCPWCQSCETEFARLVAPDEMCPSCGECKWQVKHGPAFEEYERRSNGWFGRKYLGSGEWLGPFSREELARSVRGSAPGYLICGICGVDEFGDTLIKHYRMEHETLSDAERRRVAKYVKETAGRWKAKK